MVTQIKEQALQWFVRLQDAEATEEDWLAFVDWQEADENHRRAYNLLEQTWAAVDLTAAPVMAANDKAPSSRELLSARHPSRRTWLISGLGIAAALVVTVGLWPHLTGVGVTQTYHTTTAPLTVDLADGSHVYLNRDTDLRVRLGRKQRSATLERGEVAFDVNHDPSRPFAVSAGDRSVRVLGTAFNVIRHGDQFRVSVARGVVSVTAPGLSAPVRLTAGLQLDQTSSGPVDVSRIVPDQAFSWREGVLVYRDRPIGDVAADLSRYLATPVVVDPAARSIRFTGSLQISDQQTMLGKLDDYLPITVDRSPDGIRLSARAGS
ncbi:MAG: FecR family protein [Brevundimonas sp.]